MIDTAELEALLMKDPNALDALLSGWDGQPETLAAALAPPTGVPSAAIRSAALTRELRALQLLGTLSAPSRRLLDVLT